MEVQWKDKPKFKLLILGSKMNKKLSVKIRKQHINFYKLPKNTITNLIFLLEKSENENKRPFHVSSFSPNTLTWCNVTSTGKND